MNYNKLLRRRVLKQIIINQAKRDFLNGKGRVFLSELRSMGFSPEEIKSVIDDLMQEYQIKLFEDILLIDFSKKRNDFLKL